MANKSKMAAIQVQMPGVDVDLIARFVQTDSGALAGNPYAHICKVMFAKKLLKKPQLEAAIWFAISELHAAKAKDENNPHLDLAIAACSDALKEVKSLPDDQPQKPAAVTN